MIAKDIFHDAVRHDMEKVDRYRQYAQEVIKRHGQYPPSYGDVELQFLFDSERDHYQLVHTGWHKNY